MLPTEKESINPSETEGATARSGLPPPPTSLNQMDSHDVEILKTFMCLVHGKKCVGGNNARFVPPCLSTCTFGRIQELVNVSSHLLTCVEMQCTNENCNLGHSLHQHWANCRCERCESCQFIVRLVMDSFCEYLRLKGPRYSQAIQNIRACDLLVLKDFINEHV